MASYLQIQIQIEILYQKISQIEIQIHKKKHLKILFKYTSLPFVSSPRCIVI